MKIKKPFLLFLLLPALFTAGVFFIYGEDAWAIWNIPTLQPSFIDARIITASAESYELGFRPGVENPQDPYGRLFNLPLVWRLLFLTKINQMHTDIFAGILIASFFVGLIGFAHRLKGYSALLVAFSTFSPPVLLAFERGNVDLFVFMICALSLIWLERSRSLSTLALWVAAILKIFPVFGLTSMFELNKKDFGKYTLIFLIAFGLYGVLTFDGFRQAFTNTEGGFDLSYGLGVLPYYVEVATGSYAITLIAGLISIIVVILIVFLSVRFLVSADNLVIGKDPYYLSAFRLGAGIYIGTFLLGNNWDYRFMFLLFTLPQLTDWTRQNKIGRYTLMAVMISFAYLWLAMFLPFAYFLDEFANWFVFAGLTYLMIVSLPEWAKSEMHLFLERLKGSDS